MIIDRGRGSYERLRIWTPPDFPIADAALATRSEACIEWRGMRPGHPSSYGLLGGTMRPHAPEAPLPKGPYEASLVGRHDDVSFGLPPRGYQGYRYAIAQAAPDLTVVIAALGAVGSSPHVFYALAATVAVLIEGGFPSTDEGIWSLLDESFGRARVWGQDARPTLLDMALGRTPNTRDFDLTILADRYQVLLADADADWALLSDAWTKEAEREMIARGRDYVAFGTARNTRVPVTVGLRDNGSESDSKAWDRITEAVIELPSGVLTISGVSDAEGTAERVSVAPGRYRLRISSGGLDSLTADGLDGDDRYLVELWPEPGSLVRG